MLRALHSAATGMEAQQTYIDVTSNNLANVNTVGFKKVRANFQDLIYQLQRAPGLATSIRPRFGSTGGGRGTAFFARPCRAQRVTRLVMSRTPR